jgi:DNA-binding IclR family transcriptional regulator
MNKLSSHRSTERVLDSLEFVAFGNAIGYTLSEISQKLDIPKSSIQPILHTLLQRGYLSHDKNTGRYTIGYSTFKLGSSFLGSLNIIDEITKELERVTSICLETTYCATLKEGNAFYIAKADSPEPIRMVARIGHTLPAYSTGVGKALLTDFTLQELRKLYPNGLTPLTEHTITDFVELHNQLQTAKREGFAYEMEESNQYIQCIATPIRKGERIVAAISVAIPTFRYTDEKGELICQSLFQAKNKLEKLIENTDIDLSSY